MLINTSNAQVQRFDKVKSDTSQSRVDVNYWFLLDSGRIAYFVRMDSTGFFNSTVAPGWARIISRGDSGLYYQDFNSRVRLDSNFGAIFALKTTTITAGDGLSGGGDLSTNRTITANVKIGGSLKITTDSLEVDSAGFASTDYDNSLKANKSTTITIAGTPNQIISSAGAQDLSVNRTWTLSTPQDIATSSSPTFSNLTLSSHISGNVPFFGLPNGTMRGDTSFYWDSTYHQLLIGHRQTQEGQLRVQHNQNNTYGLLIQTLAGGSNFNAAYFNYYGTDYAFGIDDRAGGNGGILIDEWDKKYAIDIRLKDSAGAGGINIGSVGITTPTGNALNVYRPSGTTSFRISALDAHVGMDVTNANALLIQDSSLTSLFNVNTSSTKRVDFNNGMDAVGWSDNLSTAKWLLDGAGATSYILGKVGIGVSSSINATLSVGSGSLTDANVPVQISTGASGAMYYGANSNGGYGLLFGYEIDGARRGAVVRNVATSPLRLVVNNTSQAVVIDSNMTITLNTATRGSDSYSTTATTDTVTVASGTTADYYFIQLTGTTAPIAADQSTVEALTGKFVLHRSASGTSGLTYNWFRIK